MWRDGEEAWLHRKRNVRDRQKGERTGQRDKEMEREMEKERDRERERTTEGVRYCGEIEG